MEGVRVAVWITGGGVDRRAATVPADGAAGKTALTRSSTSRCRGAGDLRSACAMWCEPGRPYEEAQTGSLIGSVAQVVGDAGFS